MKFHQMDPERRRETLVSEGVLTPEQAEELGRTGGLDPDVARNLIENVIGQYSLPLGVARNLTVNSKTYQVPMVTEEPSVVAAASNGARIANLNGGVAASPAQRLVTGEVVFCADSGPQAEEVKTILESHREDVFSLAAAAHPSIVSYGGGLTDLWVDLIPAQGPLGSSAPLKPLGPSRLSGFFGYFVKLSLLVNPCDAMGANIVNTISEAVANAAEAWTGRPRLVAILTNNSPLAAAVTAHVELAPETLATKTMAGQKIAGRIALLSDLAQSDPDRAVTHNKGIMNGISAAVLATGNDTRAVEAGAHAFAARTGTYLPLSQWSLNGQGKLCGQLTLPLQVGLVGGATSSLPLAGRAKKMLACQSTDEFQCLLAALGLVQNLAALRALAGPGIQEGHMALQARSLAMAAGAQGEEIEQVSDLLQKDDKSLARAKVLLAGIRDQRDQRERGERKNQNEYKDQREDKEQA